MRRGYGKMSTDDIDEFYLTTFGECYRIQVGDISDHQDDKIACLERGYAQTKEEIGPLRETVVA